MEVRHSSRDVSLPTKEALIQCKEVATTIEGADYFYEQFVDRLEQAGKLDEAQGAVNNIAEFVDVIHMQREIRSDAWSGRAGPLSDFHNLQQNMAEKAAEKVTATVQGGIKMDFAISDKAQLLRGYSANGKAIDPEAVDSLDKLFNSWLAENQLVSKESVIYEADKNGEINRNAQGQPILADAAKLRQDISNTDKGYEQFIQQLSKPDREIQMDLQQHEYPAKKAEVTTAKTTTPKTPESSAAVPETPSSEAGAGPSSPPG